MLRQILPIIAASIVLLAPAQAQFSDVSPLFELTAPAAGPFPTDRFTIADPSQNTGLRVNLPKPDCEQRPSDCEDIDVLNTLDGFNVQPRLSIPFTGSIDVHSVTSETVFLLKLVCDYDDEECDAGPEPARTGINQIVWDTFTNTLHVESDALLEQHTRYALIATRGVRDASGGAVAAAAAFRNFRQSVRGVYKDALLDAVHAARKVGVDEEQIAVASVFTTQSVTAVLEKIRDQIHAARPAPPDFLLGSGGERTVFPLDDVTGIAFRQQTRVDGPLNTPVNVNLSLLRIVPGAVGRIAFGKYVSPDYRVHPGEFIPAVATRTGRPVVQGTNEVYFTVALPSGAPPANGWPVAVFGIPGGANKEGELGLPSVAATMAEQGIATVAINIVGHGFGALGTLTVSTRQSAGGLGLTLPAGGRGIDQNADGLIERREGISAARPHSIIDDRDGFQQTVADLMQLVRTIEVGMDVDADAAPDLDASRIYYFGPSLGGMYGSAFLAVEPNVRTGVLNVPGGPRTSRVLNNNGDRPLYGSYLAARVPSLINAPGVTQIDEVPIAGLPRFTENMPLRDGVPLTVGLEDGTTRVIRSPVVNDVPGAIDIQELLERAEWVMQSGNPVAYSPYLRKAPLAGVPAKSIIIQFAKGDQTTPNPATTAMLRAGDLADRAMFYRHDLASAERPTLPKNPHVFMVGISAAFGFLEIGLPVQRQIAIFFASDGGIVIHPEPARFFELPIAGPLPEDLNYVR